MPKKPKPKFRSVATAIRTGLFMEKNFRSMSTNQHIKMPENLKTFLEVRFNT